MPHPSPDAPHAARRARWWRARRAVRREIALESLHPDVWQAAVAAAVRAFRHPGEADTPGATLWTTGATPGRSEVALWSDTGPDGVRLVAEHVRPDPRPLVLVSALLCLPIGLLAAFVLGARPSEPREWAVVAALLAVPAAVAVAVGVAAWGRTLVAAHRLRRVLAVAARTARAVGPPAAVPTASVEWDDDPELDAAPVALPAVGPSEWLTADEIDGLVARDGRVRRAHAVAQATAERQRPDLAPRAAEWL